MYLKYWVVQLVGLVVLVILACIAVISGNNFYNYFSTSLTWDWNSFIGMVVGLLFTGYVLGWLMMLKFVEGERRKAIERQKLKEEIKKEIET